VAIQGRASLREAKDRGREDPQEVSGPRARHRGEGAQGQDRRAGQEEVPGALGPDGGPVLLPDPEAGQFEAGGRPLFLRQQRHPPHLGHHGQPLPRAPRRRLFPLHRLLGRIGVRRGDI